MQVGGRVAYVPQTAWVMNETIRENICMGTPLDQHRCGTPNLLITRSKLTY